MSTIKLKRSGVAGKIPTTAQLALGEIALNTYDGRLYIKKEVSGVQSIVAISGSPASESTVYLFTATGDNSTVDFVLPTIPISEQNVFAYLNGVLQHTSEFSLVNGNTLNMSTSVKVAVLVIVNGSKTMSRGIRRQRKQYLTY